MIKKRKPFIAWLTLIAIAALPLSVAAQTQLKYHSNKFSIADDVNRVFSGLDGSGVARRAASHCPRCGTGSMV